MWLVYGDGTEAERLDVAYKICQAAEDIKWRLLQGGIIAANGGWPQVADVILSAAAELLPGHFESARDLTVVTEQSRAAVNWPPVGSTVLAEPRRVQPVTQAIIDIDPLLISAPYRQNQLGWPEWCADFGTNKQLPGETGEINKQLENLLPMAEGTVLNPDNTDKPTYRHITMKSMVPVTLFLRAVGSTYIADHPLYFNYIDRHMGEIISDDSGFVLLPGYSGVNALKDWVIEAWKDMRGIEGIWSGTRVISYKGQSEVYLALFANRSFEANALPYPTLLSGVDARQVIKARHDDFGSVDRVITVNADNITNKEISPGFVAMANIFHLATGGMPLRLVDVSRSDSDMDEMMDEDITTRLWSEEVSVVKLASTAFGSVTDSVYNWWNKEAGSAKTLWDDRAPHFYGITPAGDDYDFDAAAIDHCLIDTTGRGYGLLPSDTKVHMMMPGPEINTAISINTPPQPNYLTNNVGAAVTGRIDQLSAPSYQARFDFLTNSPAANRGRALISTALCRFGDYDGGVKLGGSSQTDIHPANLDADGRYLWAADSGVGLAIALDFYDPPEVDRFEWSADGLHVDMVVRMADGATLTTQRIQESETVASPRPQQQAVMGLVIYRSGDTDRTAHPVYRTDNTDDTLYPTAYRGTVTIQDTGTGTGGTREGVVRITPEEPFTNGDAIHFGMDGNYGEFSLHGYPDYDAHMYKDGLRTHLAALESGATTYPGIPVLVQKTSVASGITAGPAVTFTDSEQGQDFGSTSQWRRNSGLQPTIVSSWMIDPAVGYARADSADGNLSLAAPGGSTVITACCDVRLKTGSTTGTALLRLLDNTGTTVDDEFGIVFPGGTAAASGFTDHGVIDMGGGTYRVWAKMPAASVASGDRIIYDIPSSNTASDRVFNWSQPALFYQDLTPTEIEDLGAALPAP